MTNDWLDDLKSNLKKEEELPSSRSLERLSKLGMIDAKGEVTGRLHRWTAFLAITATTPSRNNRFDYFRCIKPVFGMPGPETTDISRGSMLVLLRQQKKIIVATYLAEIDLWEEGPAVILTSDDKITIDCDVKGQDYVGNLPTFQYVENGR